MIDEGLNANNKANEGAYMRKQIAFNVRSFGFIQIFAILHMLQIMTSNER